MVTVTSTEAAPAGATTVRIVPVALMPVAAAVTGPNRTTSPGTNPDPAIVTAVPPDAGPLLGPRPETTGAPYAKRSALEVGEVPAAVVTVTSTLPAPAEGTVAVSTLADSTSTPVAALAPNRTVAPGANPEPTIVTTDPPAVGPAFGLTEVTDGLAYSNWSATPVGDVPWSVVTVTSTEPVDPAGATAEIEVPESTTTLVAAAVPNRTAAPAAKPVPSMTTAVPPAGGPPFGDTPVTVGAP